MSRCYWPLSVTIACVGLVAGLCGPSNASDPIPGKPGSVESDPTATVHAATGTSVTYAQHTLKVDASSNTTKNSVQPAQHDERVVSEAERITKLKRAVEADQKTLQDIEFSLADPASEYCLTEAEFKQVDGQMEDQKAALKEAQARAASDEEVRLKLEIEKLQSQWKPAKDRFELAIQERKTIQQKAANLKQKIHQERETLAKLTGVEGPTSPSPTAQPQALTPSTASPMPDATGTSAAGPSSAVPEPAVLPTPVAAAPANPATPVQDNGTSMPMTPAATGIAAVALPNAPLPTATVEKPTSKELIKATEDAQKKEVVAREAEKEVQSVVERIELLRKDIELEQQLLATTRKKADMARDTEQQLQQEYEDKLRAGAAADAIEELRQKLSQVRQRFSDNRKESRERVNRIDELQSRYATLQSEQIIALQQAEGARLEANTAQKTVEALRNPFTARNMVQWLIDHGPRVAVIFLAMFIALWMTHVTKYRIVDLMLKRGGLGQRVDLENRARTLVGVFENAAKVAVVCGGSLMILDAIGAPIATLMGGAAVFGLAIAFGAQSLIKDYFYGFMILLEQQYTINDVIKIGDIAGQVERITLRVTVLRDLEGRVHFIPHGAITSTTNMTHGWSRAVFEVGVAYKEDADRVIDLIKQLGQEMRNDPFFAPMFLEDLTMLGVDAFGDSAIVIKFFIKTKPLKQWEVKRELLRRVKIAFDKNQIEIPFPHRTVYHRHVEDEVANLGVDEPLRKSA